MVASAGGRSISELQGVVGGMSQGGARARWRDSLVLLVLGVVIVAGLVHYGRDLTESDDRSADQPSQAPTSSLSPSAEATAELDSAPPADPVSPPTPPDRTCWDGRETTSLRLCGLPEGARGLEWVFPSFARDRPQCHRARPNPDSYPVLESYECFQQALGGPVTVTYDQVQDPAQVEQWLLARVGPEHRRRIEGPNGGRSIFKDGANRPVRITGTYGRFPYVVSVYADRPQAASRAWRALVEIRSETQIRGIKND